MSESADTPAVEPVAAPTAEVPAAETPQAEAAPETPETPETPAGEAAEPTAETPEPKKSPVAQLQGRVGHLTKTLHEKDASLAEQAKQLAAYKALFEAQGKTPDGETPATLPPAVNQPPPGSPEFDALVDRAATQKAAAQKFTADCNAVFEQGEKTHGNEFKEAVTNLNALGMMSEQVVEAAIATGAAADVLHFLGTDVDEAARITNLSPIRMAAELTKLAGKLTSPGAAPEISRAPAPIKPIGGAVKPEVDIADPNLSMGDYVARRKAMGAKWAK